MLPGSNKTSLGTVPGIDICNLQSAHLHLPPLHLLSLILFTLGSVDVTVINNASVDGRKVQLTLLLYPLNLLLLV